MSTPSRSAMLVCTAAAATAAVQPWLMLALGEVDVSTLNSLLANAEVAGRMFTALLVFMPPMFVAYWIATRAVAGAVPTLASFASFAFALWFALEPLPRSFDLWVVHARWLPAPSIHCWRCGRGNVHSEGERTGRATRRQARRKRVTDRSVRRGGVQRPAVSV